MSLILGIYHRRNQLNRSAVQPMVDALGDFPYRHLSERLFPGFLAVCVSELEGEDFFAGGDGSNGVAALVGTMVADGMAHPRAVDGFWETWKVDPANGPTKMEGTFAACVYDAAAHRLHLVNDKFGMRPMFVVETPDYVAFCSEFEPLLKLPGYRFVLDDAAVAEYFCLGTTLDGHTFASGIRNLAAASILEVAREHIHERTYWQPRIAIDHVRSLEEHAAHIVEVLKTVVPDMLSQLTNARCLVSAGADTRLILSCMPLAYRNSLPFLTSSLAVLPMADDRDVIGAQALAARLHLNHEVNQVAFSELEFGTAYFDRVKRARYRKILGGWHGGEYLGGFCSLAAPIRKAPDAPEVEERLQNTFSRRFRRNLSRHPMEGYAQAMAAIETENHDFLFQIQQLGRAFFSGVYHGSRGSWLQPYEIVNQGNSPFWDSRVLQALLAVPFEYIAGYQLYNVIFRDHLTELADIPSNSPLTQRPDSAIPRMTAGQEPKVVLQPKYQSALDAYRKDAATWRRRLYRWWRIRRVLGDGNSPVTMKFIDFEAWWRRYVVGK